MPNAAESFIVLTSRIDMGLSEALYRKICRLESPQLNGDYSPKDNFSDESNAIDTRYAEDLRLFLKIIQNDNINDDIRYRAAWGIKFLMALHQKAEFFNSSLLQEVEISASLEALKDCLSNNNPKIRKAAILALGGFTHRLAVSSLMYMIHDKDIEVQCLAISQLGEIGDTYAVDFLIDCLENKNLGIRGLSADSLGKIGDQRAIAPLSKIGCNDPDIGVKLAAFTALNSVDRPTAIQLSNKFYNADNIELKFCSACVLAKNGDQNALQFLLNHPFRMGITALELVQAFIYLEDLSAVKIFIGLLESFEEKKGWYNKIFLLLMKFFKSHPVETTNAFIDALNKGEISIGVVKKIIEKTDTVRNPDAYLQYHSNKKDKIFSYTSSFPSDDIGKVSYCCKTILKISSEAIAILDQNHQKKSIHALSCPAVKAAYWS